MYNKILKMEAQKKVCHRVLCLENVQLILSHCVSTIMSKPL